MSSKNILNKIIVSDAGPLISAEKIPKGYNILKKIFDAIYIPRQVYDELTVYSDNYFSVHNLHDFLIVKSVTKYPIFQKHLGKGEKAAISLALDNKLDLLIDEKNGRKEANSLGIPIIGFGGIIIHAFKLKKITNDAAVSMIKALLYSRRIDHKTFTALNNLLAEQII